MHVRPFFVSLCLLVKCFTCDANTGSPFEDFEGYYWRDYNGQIPKDAFLADIGVGDGPLYIAQVLHSNLLIPGVIDQSLTTDAIYEYGNEERRTSTNVKIFCTEHSNGLEWAQTNTDDFFIDNDYIVGGYESGNKVFIGKSWQDGNPVIGKVIVHDSDPVFLHTTYSGEAIRLRNFQVLRVERSFDSATPTSDYDVTTLKPRSETEGQPSMSTEHQLHHTETSSTFYPAEPRFHRFIPSSSPRPYRLRGDHFKWRPTRSWIGERFNSLRPSTSPRPRFYKEDHLPRGVSISKKPNSITLTNNEKCTCSKGTVIINFN